MAFGETKPEIGLGNTQTDIRFMALCEVSDHDPDKLRVCYLFPFSSNIYFHIAEIEVT